MTPGEREQFPTSRKGEQLNMDECPRFPSCPPPPTCDWPCCHSDYRTLSSLETTAGLRMWESQEDREERGQRLNTHDWWEKQREQERDGSISVHCWGPAWGQVLRLQQTCVLELQ